MGASHLLICYLMERLKQIICYLGNWHVSHKIQHFHAVAAAPMFLKKSKG